MTYLLYSALYAVALVFLLPFEYLKRSQGLRKRWLLERFGFYSEARTAAHTVWVHAVSVGEVIASVALIKEIKQRYPLLEIIISTVTDTGQKVALERAGAYAEIVYVPFDLPFAVKNALRHIRPSVFIIIETELWPNAIRMTRASNVPVILMNGRLSERSYKRYEKLGFFIKNVLQNISLLCVQDDIYAGRFRHLGAAPERTKVIGSFKFDTQPSSHIPQWTEALNGPVIIAGSTHETEEALVLDVYMRLKSDFPLLNLIIAPRHPGRFKAVEEMIKKRGLSYRKRSELANNPDPATRGQSGNGDTETRGNGETEIRGNGDTEKLESRDTETRGHGDAEIQKGVNVVSPRPRVAVSPRQEYGVVLLDVVGELSAVYGAADIAVIGGSFIEHGGQNPLEPAFWGKAIVCGPHMENFPFIGGFYSGGGAVRAEAPLLYGVLKELLDSPEQMRQMGSIAKVLYEKNSGAVERAMELIEEYLVKL